MVVYYKIIIVQTSYQHLKKYTNFENQSIGIKINNCWKISIDKGFEAKVKYLQFISGWYYYLFYWKNYL